MLTSYFSLKLGRGLPACTSQWLQKGFWIWVGKSFCHLQPSGDIAKLLECGRGTPVSRLVSAHALIMLLCVTIGALVCRYFSGLDLGAKAQARAV